MRFNYYEFPETVDAHTRWINGALGINGYGSGENKVCTEAEYIISGINISTAKKLLKKFGGCAWTEHCERDGTVFEVTEIKLKGNNSTHKYNIHL